MKTKIEIIENKSYNRFELWQHFLNEPKDILFPVKYSNFIDFDKSREFLIILAKEKFNIRIY